MDARYIDTLSALPQCTSLMRQYGRKVLSLASDSYSSSYCISSPCFSLFLMVDTGNGLPQSAYG
ncbi:hypothetical protein H5410_062883 [Solanum commersonii]|uniref:Uncharacterized protein n=1 Tax=Solanum commersonii TaxID=4109 RepID=A0A9J5WC71_SOLCO|nr:hypothetical protein H5410_062883 [Solanum commersonii]